MEYDFIVDFEKWTLAQICFHFANAREICVTEKNIFEYNEFIIYKFHPRKKLIRL